MNLPEGAIPIEQWKPDQLKIAKILAEILGRQNWCKYDVVDKDGNPINCG